jgi:hypothetical protein
MTTDSENQKQKPGPQLPRTKGGGDGDAKAADSGTRRARQPNQTDSSQASPEPPTKNRKITSSRR